MKEKVKKKFLKCLKGLEKKQSLQPFLTDL